MKYRTFGSTGLEVSAIGFGAMPLSLTPARPSENDAIAVVHHAIDLGITLIDTADSYCIDTTEGRSQRAFDRQGHGAAAAGYPQQGGDRYQRRPAPPQWPLGPQWPPRAPARRLRAVAKESRGGTHRHLLLPPHRPTKCLWLTASANSRGWQGEGKIAHVAVSNHSVSEIDAARSLVGVIGVQNEYSLRHRLPERQAGTAPTGTEPDTSGTLAAFGRARHGIRCVGSARHCGACGEPWAHQAQPWPA